MDLHTGDVFWPIRDGLPRSYPSLRRSISTNIAVLGGGITGALVAHALATEGLDVVVLDERDIGMGSSSASTGLLQYATDTSLEALSTIIGEDDAALVYRTGVEAIDDLERLIPSLDDRCGFSRRSSLYLAADENAVDQLSREFALRQTHGFDVEWWDDASVRRRSSLTAPAALHSQEDGEVDCFRLVHAALAAAVERGTRVFDRTRVVQVDRPSRGIRLETAEGHEVRAEHLVIAAGYDATRYLRRRTGRLHSTWAFVSEPVDGFPGWPDRCLIWETARPYLYLRTTDDGRVLAGGEDEVWATRHANPTTLIDKTDRLAARVRSMFPALTCEIAYRWSGVFGTTDDGLPYIGASPECARTWFAMGYGGNGITFSMTAAAVLREALCGRVHPAAHLFAFDRPRPSLWRRWRARVFDGL